MECTSDYSKILQRIENLERENKVLNDYVDLHNVVSWRGEGFEEAISYGKSDLVELYLAKKIRKADAMGREAKHHFFLAIEKGQLVCADILLKYGAGVDNTGYFHQKECHITPLEYTALDPDKLSTLEWVLQRQPDIQKTRALNFACEVANVAGIRLLLKAGVQPTTNTWFSNTISYAPKENREEIQRIFDEFAAANQKEKAPLLDSIINT